jgi:hypothetical protein
MRVYRSQDRRWRVEVDPDGRCRIYRDHALVRRCATITLAAEWLCGHGVTADDLIED